MARHRVIQSRPNVLNVRKPETEDEKQLAIACTRDARAANVTKAEVLLRATCAYNNAVLLNNSNITNPAIPTKGLMSTTTTDHLKQFWIDASKYSSGPLHDAVVSWGPSWAGGGSGTARTGAERGGAEKGRGSQTGRSALATARGSSSGKGAANVVSAATARGTSCGVGVGVGSRGGAGSRGGLDLAGDARPGEVFVMSDDEIDLLGVKKLQRTLRSLEGIQFASAVKAPELKEMLKEAVRDRRKRKMPE